MQTRKNRNKEELPYNKPFRDRTESIKKPTKEHSTRRGYYSSPDKKKLPPETLNYLLDIYNKIWEQEEIPKTWKHAKKKTLAEGGKRPKIYSAQYFR